LQALELLVNPSAALEAQVDSMEQAIEKNNPPVRMANFHCLFTIRTGRKPLKKFPFNVTTQPVVEITRI
jgi:hypothetical protein